MSIGLTDNYILQIKFGQTDIPVNVSALRECTITQDIRKFLPDFRLDIDDTSGLLSHVVPFDASMSRISMTISTTIDAQNTDYYDFTVYRRELTAKGLAHGDYDIRGLLTLDGLNSPNWTRSFNSTVTSTLIQLANEMGITNYDLSSSLSLTKTLIQPNWTNAQFLTYLAQTLQGNNNASNYRCFIRLSGNTQTLVFRTMNELVNSSLVSKYILSDKSYQDYKPAYNYEILDNYKLLGTLGCKVQNYTYFSYETGTYIKTSTNLLQTMGLAEYHLIDKSDDDQSLEYTSTGRTNNYHLTFNALTNSLLETRVNDLVKMWLIVDGDLTVKVGNVVQVLFPQGFDVGKVYSYQYSGYWLVERVVYHFDKAFRMHLLLTRNGVDIESATTLVPATIWRK